MPLSVSSAPVTSIGFTGVAKPGSTAFILAFVAGGISASGRPKASAASAAMTQLAPELLTTTTRSLFGRQPFR